MIARIEVSQRIVSQRAYFFTDKYFDIYKKYVNRWNFDVRSCETSIREHTNTRYRRLNIWGIQIKEAYRNINFYIYIFFDDGTRSSMFIKFYQFELEFNATFQRNLSMAEENRVHIPNLPSFGATIRKLERLIQSIGQKIRISVAACNRSRRAFLRRTPLRFRLSFPRIYFFSERSAATRPNLWWAIRRTAARCKKHSFFSENDHQHSTEKSSKPQLRSDDESLSLQMYWQQERSAFTPDVDWIEFNLICWRKLACLESSPFLVFRCLSCLFYFSLYRLHSRTSNESPR